PTRRSSDLGCAGATQAFEIVRSPLHEGQEARGCRPWSLANQRLLLVRRLCFRRLLLLPDQLQLDVNADFVADQDATGLKQLVPLQTPVLAVDARLRRQARAVGPPRALGDAAVLNIKLNFARLAPDGQVAIQLGVVVIDQLDTLAAEGEFRVVFNIQKICGAQVRVTLGLKRVDAGCVDGDVDTRLLGLLRVEIDGAGKLLEPATDVADHHMPDLELDQ